jgi:cytochrome c peroxidase
MKRRIVLLSCVLLCCLGFKASFTAGKFPKPVYPIPDPSGKDSSLVSLGRLLFFDPILSADSSISCASCHTPHNAFAHTDHDLSHGINDQIGKRNAPALFNLAWQQKFMWDGAVNHIEVQALAPLLNSEEMGASLPDVLHKLNNSSFYKARFFAAFGDSNIQSKALLQAMAAFELNLISNASRYDRVMAGKDQFSETEEKGYRLFQQHCNRCHREPLFSNYQFASNGLPVDSQLRDFGRHHITHVGTDSLLFKTPSLRNLSYSYPYMHDGRFQNLYEVLEHYSNGVQVYGQSPQLLANALHLNARQKTELVAFLLTLNDSAFVNNPEYNFPKILLRKNEGNFQSARPNSKSSDK